MLLALGTQKSHFCITSNGATYHTLYPAVAVTSIQIKIKSTALHCVRKFYNALEFCTFFFRIVFLTVARMVVTMLSKCLIIQFVRFSYC